MAAMLTKYAEYSAGKTVTACGSKNACSIRLLLSLKPNVDLDATEALAFHPCIPKP